MFDSVSFEFENLSMLCPGFDLYSAISENREFESFLGPENCLDRVDLEGIEEIRVLTGESIDGFWDRETHIQIAGFGPDSIVSFATELDRHAVIDPSRDVDFFLNLLCLASFSVTCYTLLCDNFPSSMTLITHTRLFHNPEDRLSSFANMSGSATYTTLLWFGSFLGTGSATFVTEGFTTVGYGFFGS